MSHTPHWSYALASIAGRKHLKAGALSEDNACIYPITEPQGTTSGLIAIVCDGAGSASKGREGAQWLSHTLGGDLVLIISDNHTLPEEARIILSLASLRNQLALKSSESGHIISDYHTTCICLISIAGQGSCLFHIGDGRAAWRSTAGEWKSAMTPHSGEYAGETVFFDQLFDSEARFQSDYFELRYFSPEEVSAFALLSDGCERASFELNHGTNVPYQRFFETNWQALKQMSAAEYTQEQINSIWTSYLESGTDVLREESDDKSMILISID